MNKIKPGDYIFKLALGQRIETIKRGYEAGVKGWFVTQKKPLLSEPHTGFLTTEQLVCALKDKQFL